MVREGAMPERRPSRLDGALAFLREELAPSPERWRATARICLSCAIAVVLIAWLQIPSGSGPWIIISIFVVSMPNAGSTFQKGIERMIGTLIACASGMVLVAAFVDVPWVRVPIGGFAAGFAIFCFRTTTAPYAAVLGGITFAMFFLHPGNDVDAIVAFGLWRAGLITLAVAIVLVVDLLILPTDPERLLLEDLERRLAAVKGVLDRTLESFAGAGGVAPDAVVVAEPTPRGAGRARARDLEEAQELRDLVLAGPAAEIDLLRDAEARHRTLRDRHPEQIVLITAVERLATGSLALLRALDATGAERNSIGGPVVSRLRGIAEGVRAVRRCIADRHAPRIWTPPRESDLAADAVVLGAYEGLLPSIVEMEEALRQAARSLGFLGGPEARPLAPPEQLRSVLDAPPSGLLTPAFSLSNTAEVKIALKAALAEVLVYLIISATQWPGISTGLVTVLVIAGASNGAMVHKALLRCAGATLGGLVGMIAILVGMPLVTTIAGFLPLSVACFAVAAWITAGGPRISYVGMQAGIALGLVLCDSLGPTTNLEIARDRVLGIMIADSTTTLVFFALWPVSAVQGMKSALAGTVRAIADLSRVGAKLIDEDLVRPARGFRWQVYQGLASTLSMHDEAAFEADASTPEVVRARARVRRLLPLVQETFLASLGVANHRVDVDLRQAPEPIVETLRAYSAAVGVKLDALADRLGSVGERESADLRALLVAAEAGVEGERSRMSASPESAGVLTHVEARLEVQRELLALIERLDAATAGDQS